jgi:hypothetical protein
MWMLLAGGGLVTFGVVLGAVISSMNNDKNTNVTNQSSGGRI